MVRVKVRSPDDCNGEVGLDEIKSSYVITKDTKSQTSGIRIIDTADKILYPRGFIFKYITCRRLQIKCRLLRTLARIGAHLVSEHIADREMSFVPFFAKT